MSENDICGDLLGNTMDIMVHIKEKVSIINATFFPSLLIQLFCIHLIATQATTLSVMQRFIYNLCDIDIFLHACSSGCHFVKYLTSDVIVFHRRSLNPSMLITSQKQSKAM